MTTPIISKKDVYRIIREFMNSSDPEQLEDQFVAFGIDTEAIEPLLHTAGTSAMVMYTSIKVREDDEEFPNPVEVQRIGELCASVGVSFFLIGFEVARQVNARA